MNNDPTRVYLIRSEVAHLLPPHASPNGGFYGAYCGVSPPWYNPHGWHGTGSQDEIDKALAKRTCKRCEKVMSSHD